MHFLSTTWLSFTCVVALYPRTCCGNKEYDYDFDVADGFADLKKGLMATADLEHVLDEFWYLSEKDLADQATVTAARSACKSIMVNFLRAEEEYPHLVELTQRLARYCAYHVGGKGIWKHHQQWGSIYNPDLRGEPLFSRPLTFWPELEQAITQLEEQLPAMEKEYERNGQRTNPKDQILLAHGKWTGTGPWPRLTTTTYQ